MRYRSPRLWLGCVVVLCVCSGWDHTVEAAQSVERHVRNEVRAAVKLLDDRPEQDRFAAVADLALLATETWEPESFEAAVEALLEAVEAQDEEVARLAADALIEVRARTDLPAWAGAILCRRVRGALESSDAAGHLLACRFLLELDPLDPPAWAVYAELLCHKKPEVRAQARSLLPRLIAFGRAAAPGFLLEKLRTEQQSRDLDRRFDADLALWIVAQLTGDTAGLGAVEEDLTRAVVTTRSVDLDPCLDRLIAAAGIEPVLAPGTIWVAALRRVIEEQPPGAALRAGVALALMAPRGADPELALPLQRALPGYLAHPSPAIRLTAADLIGRHHPARLFPASADSGEEPVMALIRLPSVVLPTSVRQALTNLFALPASTTQLRALERLARDSGVVAEHGKALSEALVRALTSADPDVRSAALAPGFLAAYERPEAAEARGQWSRIPRESGGVSAEAAVGLGLHFLLTNSVGEAFAESLIGLVDSDSPSARRAVGVALLQAARRRDSDNPVVRALLRSAPRHLGTLARDDHPAVAALGVAGLLTATVDRNTGSVSEACRRRLVDLLEASEPSVRCRFVNVVRGVPVPGGAALQASIPQLDQRSGNLGKVYGLLEPLLRESDPLFQEQLLRAFATLGLEPPQASLSDPHPWVRAAAIRAHLATSGDAMPDAVRGLLREALEADHPEVVVAAATALILSAAQGQSERLGEVEAAGRALARRYRPDVTLHRAIVRAYQVTGTPALLSAILDVVEQQQDALEPADRTAAAALLRDLVGFIDEEQIPMTGAERRRLAAAALAYAELKEAGARANGLLVLGQLMFVGTSAEESESWTRGWREQAGQAMLSAMGSPDVPVVLAVLQAGVRVDGQDLSTELAWSASRDRRVFLEATLRRLTHPNWQVRESAACAVLASALVLGDRRSAEEAYAILIGGEANRFAFGVWTSTFPLQYGPFLSLPGPPRSELFLRILLRGPDATVSESMVAGVRRMLLAEPQFFAAALRQLNPETCAGPTLQRLVRDLVTLLGDEPQSGLYSSAPLLSGSGVVIGVADWTLSAWMRGTSSRCWIETVVGVLDDLTGSPDPRERMSALVCLSRFGGPGGVLESERSARLQALATDPEARIRLAVLQGLESASSLLVFRQSAGDELKQVVVARLGDPDSEVRTAAAALVSRWPRSIWQGTSATPVLETLVGLLEQAEGEVLALALRVLPWITAEGGDARITDAAYAAVQAGASTSEPGVVRARWLLALSELQVQQALDRDAYETLRAAKGLIDPSHPLWRDLDSAESRVIRRPAVAKLRQEEAARRKQEEDAHRSPEEWSRVIRHSRDQPGELATVMVALEWLLRHPETTSQDLAVPVDLLANSAEPALNVIEQTFRTHLTDTRHRASLLIGLAAIEHRRGNLVAAVNLVEEALELDPFAAQQYRAGFYWVDGLWKTQGHEEAFQAVLKVYNRKDCADFADTAFESLLRLLPPLPRDTTTVRGWLKALEGSAQEAADPRVKAKQWTSAAAGWIEIGQFDRAERCCRLAIVLDPDKRTRARFHLARMGRAP